MCRLKKVILRGSVVVFMVWSRIRHHRQKQVSSLGDIEFGKSENNFFFLASYLKQCSKFSKIFFKNYILDTLYKGMFLSKDVKDVS